MKKLCLLVITALTILSIPLPVLAEEEARYNFASAQGNKELQIQSGQEGIGFIYFYNIDGNRITHISLEVSAAPDGWDISIEPPSGETQVLVSGMPVTIVENLYVEPSELLADEPQNIPDDMVSIRVAGRGYTLGKMAKVIISVPELAPLCSVGTINIAAEAAWLGQSGSASVKQARDFEFAVTVVSGQKEYSEVIVKPGDTHSAVDEKAEAVENNRPAVTPVAGMTWVWIIIAGAAIIIIILLVIILRRKG